MEMCVKLLRIGDRIALNFDELRDNTQIYANVDLGYKLKSDSYDGGTPLRKFFSQFDLIARANCWSDATKA